MVLLIRLAEFDEISMGGLFLSDPSGNHVCSSFEPIQPSFTRDCSIIFEVAPDSAGFYIIFVDQEIMGTDTV